MTNEQLREKLALALEDMKAKALEMGIEGVAAASEEDYVVAKHGIAKLKDYISEGK